MEDTIIPALINLKDIFISTWELIDEFVIGIVKSLVLAIETTLEVAFAAIRLLLNILAGDWDGAWESIKDIFSAFVEFFVGVHTAFGVDIVADIKRTLGNWKSAWDTAWGALVSGFNGIFINPIIDAINGIKTAIETAIRGIGNIQIPSPSIGGFSLNPLDHFAAGVQDFAGGLAYVHKGEVLANLPRGTDVIPASQVGGGGGRMAMAGGNTYNFNFPNYIGSREDLKSFINEARTEFGRRGN